MLGLISDAAGEEKHGVIFLADEVGIPPFECGRLAAFCVLDDKATHGFLTPSDFYFFFFGGARCWSKKSAAIAATC